MGAFPHAPHLSHALCVPRFTSLPRGRRGPSILPGPPPREVAPQVLMRGMGSGPIDRDPPPPGSCCPSYHEMGCRYISPRTPEGLAGKRLAGDTHVTLLPVAH